MSPLQPSPQSIFHALLDSIGPQIKERPIISIHYLIKLKLSFQQQRASQGLLGNFLESYCLFVNSTICLCNFALLAEHTPVLRCGGQQAELPVAMAAIYEHRWALPGLQCTRHAHELAEGRQWLRPFRALCLEACRTHTCKELGRCTGHHHPC